MPIPNIFHFINVGPREFNMLHFLSIYSAFKLNQPEKIYVYVDHKQKNNIYWDILQDIVEYEFINTPTEYNGIPLKYYQYKADIIRMEKLIERGGIYMDLDVLSLKPLTHLLKHNIVLGSEISVDQYSRRLEDFGSITNAVIMTEPNNDFIKFWYKEIGNNLVGKPWAYHAVCLPKKLLLENKNFVVHLEPSKTFMPFCFRNPYVWKDEQKYRIKELDDSYTVHLWETIWTAEFISKLNIQFFNKRDNIITELFGPYIEILKNNTDKLKKLIMNCMEANDANKLVDYTTMINGLNELK